MVGVRASEVAKYAQDKAMHALRAVHRRRLLRFGSDRCGALIEVHFLECRCPRKLCAHLRMENGGVPLFAWDGKRRTFASTDRLLEDDLGAHIPSEYTSDPAVLKWMPSPSVV